MVGAPQIFGEGLNAGKLKIYNKMQIRNKS
jgi:hypothetical protein